MKKNKIIFGIFFAVVFLLTNVQNIAAQNNSVAVDAEEDKGENTKKEQEYNLTIDKVDPSRFNTVAIIQGLNKITAKTLLLEIKVGDTIKFGKLSITAHKCWQAPLDQKPESKILLEIYDSGNKDDSRTRIFYGWMFSSSPSISALEHPIYDIAAVGCKNK